MVKNSKTDSKFSKMLDFHTSKVGHVFSDARNANFNPYMSFILENSVEEIGKAVSFPLIFNHLNLKPVLTFFHFNKIFDI